MATCAADRRRTGLWWFTGAACLLCCLGPILAAVGAAGVLTAGLGQFVIGLAVAALAAFGRLLTRRRKCSATCACGQATALPS
ncbi:MULTISPECIES: hypothetical protein [unclassified Saccharothrix]|uniref:hypothetical protein n=1 Tax=unclassified Saccharothrix TaxID=2593673 RepID=UPI00307EE50B